MGSGLYSRQLTGALAQNTYEVFVPLSRWGDGVDTITNFKAGSDGDVLNMAAAEGLSGGVYTKADGADTLVYFIESGVPNLAGARLLLRLQNVAPSALNATNLNGSPFS